MTLCVPARLLVVMGVMPLTGIYLPCRSNLIENMHRQYIRTGYIWEQYDDQQGSGKVILFCVFNEVEASVVWEGHAMATT